jgi:hypothetical protein
VTTNETLAQNLSNGVQKEAKKEQISNGIWQQETSANLSLDKIFVIFSITRV